MPERPGKFVQPSRCLRAEDVEGPSPRGAADQRSANTFPRSVATVQDLPDSLARVAVFFPRTGSTSSKRRVGCLGRHQSENAGLGEVVGLKCVARDDRKDVKQGRLPAAWLWAERMQVGGRRSALVDVRMCGPRGRSHEFAVAYDEEATNKA